MVLSTAPSTSPSIDIPFIQVYGRGTYSSSDIHDELWLPGAPIYDFDDSNPSATFYIKRICDNCLPSHHTIVYKRMTAVPSSMNIKSLFIHTWASTPNNILNTDFKLFSSMFDALNDNNPWTYCNYDDTGIGFPRDCGPIGLVSGQWTSETRYPGENPDVGYYLYDA